MTGGAEFGTLTTLNPLIGFPVIDIPVGIKFGFGDSVLGIPVIGVIRCGLGAMLKFAPDGFVPTADIGTACATPGVGALDNFGIIKQINRFVLCANINIVRVGNCTMPICDSQQNEQNMQYHKFTAKHLKQSFVCSLILWTWFV